MIDEQDDRLLGLMRDSETREQGFRELMGKYQERVYWHVRKFVMDHDDANDIVQNTFIKVYRSIDRFRGHAKLYTWIYKIASNEAITYVNRKKRNATSSLEQEGLDTASRLQADEYFDGTDAQRLLFTALATLPDKQRLVFNMRYFDEMPYQEISEALRTSVGALKASYHHAVKKLEHYFKNVQV